MSKATASKKLIGSSGKLRRRHITSLVALAPIALAGCAVKTPPQIRTSHGESSAITTLNLLPPDEKQTQRMAMHSALVKEFGERGVSLSPQADNIGEFAIASTDANLGVYMGKAGKTGEEPRPVAEPRDPKWLDICSPVRVQATLAVFDKGSGNLTKRSRAHSTICKGDALPYATLSKVLADDLLAQ